MKCNNCPYHSITLGQHWCDIGNIPKRLDGAIITIDIPCTKYKRKQLKEQNNK